MKEQKRILAVDDDDRVLFVLRETLSGLNGCEVITARNGREALDRIQEQPFDLVITDLVMPEVDGLALTEAIRSIPCDTAVVWVTAHGCKRVSQDIQRLRIFRCLEKPLEIRTIRRIAREALGENEQRERI